MLHGVHIGIRHSLYFFSLLPLLYSGRPRSDREAFVRADPLGAVLISIISPVRVSALRHVKASTTDHCLPVDAGLHPALFTSLTEHKVCVLLIHGFMLLAFYLCILAFEASSIPMGRAPHESICSSLRQRILSYASHVCSEWPEVVEWRDFVSFVAFAKLDIKLWLRM